MGYATDGSGPLVWRSRIFTFSCKMLKKLMCFLTFDDIGVSVASKSITLKSNTLEYHSKEVIVWDSDSLRVLLYTVYTLRSAVSTRLPVLGARWRIFIEVDETTSRQRVNNYRI